LAQYTVNLPGQPVNNYALTYSGEREREGLAFWLKSSRRG
jgi:hypothetical protein